MGGRIPGAHRERKGVSRGACWTVHPDALQLGERGEQAEQAVGATDRTRIQAHGGQGMSAADVTPDSRSLLPCPFCGKEPKVAPQNPKLEGSAWAVIRCPDGNCPGSSGAKIMDMDDVGGGFALSEASRRWNQRVHSLSPGEVVATPQDTVAVPKFESYHIPSFVSLPDGGYRGSFDYGFRRGWQKLASLLGDKGAIEAEKAQSKSDSWREWDRLNRESGVGQ